MTIYQTQKEKFKSTVRRVGRPAREDPWTSEDYETKETEVDHSIDERPADEGLPEKLMLLQNKFHSFTLQFFFLIESSYFDVGGGYSRLHTWFGCLAQWKRRLYKTSASQLSGYGMKNKVINRDWAGELTGAGSRT